MIENEKDAINAVKEDGDALKYVRDRELFNKIEKTFY